MRWWAWMRVGEGRSRRAYLVECGGTGAVVGVPGSGRTRLFPGGRTWSRGSGPRGAESSNAASANKAAAGAGAK